MLVDIWCGIQRTDLDVGLDDWIRKGCMSVLVFCAPRML